MYKTYNAQTLDQTDFDADPDLKNSYGNTFTACVFEGVIEQINFARATFDNSCDYTDPALEFDTCSFAGINPSGGGSDPVTEAPSVKNCVTGAPEVLGVDAPARRYSGTVIQPTSGIGMPVSGFVGYNPFTGLF